VRSAESPVVPVKCRTPVAVDLQFPENVRLQSILLSLSLLMQKPIAIVFLEGEGTRARTEEADLDIMRFSNAYGKSSDSQRSSLKVCK
jgi:hypothetical protein